MVESAEMLCGRRCTTSCPSPGAEEDGGNGEAMGNGEAFVASEHYCRGQIISRSSRVYGDMTTSCVLRQEHRIAGLTARISEWGGREKLAVHEGISEFTEDASANLNSAVNTIATSTSRINTTNQLLTRRAIPTFTQL